MDAKFLGYYKSELALLRENAQEFAAKYPKIAGRLQLTETECMDPYVERLLEGFAFLSARIQKKFDDSYSYMAESLLNTMFPIATAPIPSMSIVEIEADISKVESSGFNIPKGTELIYKEVEEKNSAEITYSTAMPLTIWPIYMESASYLTSDFGKYIIPEDIDVKAAISIKLKTKEKTLFSDLKIDTIPVFITVPNESSTEIMENIFSENTGVIIHSNDSLCEYLPKESISLPDYRRERGMFPETERTFSGIRLLLEYFSFPFSFNTFEISGLKNKLKNFKTNEVEIVILLKSAKNSLKKHVKTKAFSITSVPVTNIFKKRLNRLSYTKFEDMHLSTDKMAPMNYEVYSIDSITGFDNNNNQLLSIYPFYKNEATDKNTLTSCYSLRRVQRDIDKNITHRSKYFGTELYISFAGKEFQKYKNDLKEFSVLAYCTNRDLPLFIKRNIKLTAKDIGVNGVFLTQPTAPMLPIVSNEKTYEALSFLKLAYSHLFSDNTKRTVLTLKNIMKLYSPNNSDFATQQIIGLSEIQKNKIVRKIVMDGNVCFINGLEMTIVFDEKAFSGVGCFLLGIVIKELLMDYVSINSFIEVVISSIQRGEIVRWEPKIKNK